MAHTVLHELRHESVPHFSSCWASAVIVPASCLVGRRPFRGFRVMRMQRVAELPCLGGSCITGCMGIGGCGGV